MEVYVKGVLWDWSEAKIAIKYNSKHIVESNFDPIVLEACARGMKILQQRETALLDLYSHPGLPKPLLNYYAARNDAACSKCWLSSAGPTHQECRLKIDRHFRTEDELFEFARQECKPEK